MVNCPDCGVAPGVWHRPGCPSELWPYCGDPVVDCDCADGPAPLDDRMPWGGLCPWLEACLRFGFFGRRAAGAGVPCGPDDAGAQPDVMRRSRACAWCLRGKRFVRRR